MTIGIWDVPADLGNKLYIVGEARLLVPADVIFGDAAADADGMRGRKPAMHLDQQLHVRSERLPHPLHELHGEVFVLLWMNVRHGPGTGSNLSAE